MGGRIATSCLKRNSLGQHKATASLDASRFLVSPAGASALRPASSSGVPLVESAQSEQPNAVAGFGLSILPRPLSRKGTGYFSVDVDEETSLSQATSAIQSLDMGATCSHHKETSSSNSILDETDSIRRINSTSEFTKHKEKDGKPRWLSQLKDWVSVSEPPVQALKQYKKGICENATIALDDPHPNAKLHLPIGTLFRDAKLAGREPDPELTNPKEMGRREKLQEICPYQGSK